MGSGRLFRTAIFRDNEDLVKKTGYEEFAGRVCRKATHEKNIQLALLSPSINEQQNLCRMQNSSVKRILRCSWHLDK
jgi:hypothetical protein